MWHTSESGKETTQKKEMKIKKKFGDRIYLEWIDALEITGWKSVTESMKISDEVFCRTSGFFLNQTKDFITVAHTIGKSEKNDVTGVMHIPVRWIKKLR